MTAITRIEGKRTVSRHSNIDPRRCPLSAILATFVFVCSVAPVVSDTLYFQPTNVGQPSLYQSMQLRFTGWSTLANDPTMQAGDWVYFISSPASATSGACSVTLPAGASQYFTTISNDASFATVSLVVDPAVFTVNTNYAACYISTSNNQATFTQNSLVSGNGITPTTFTVLAAIYQAYSVSPTVVYAGQGLITVSITESDASSSGRALNQGGLGSLRPYFYACGTNCNNYVTLVDSCSTGSGVVFSSVAGYTTTNIQGSFTAPQQPDAAGYIICVPYCFSSTAGCNQASYPMSWTVVVASTFTVQPSNPSVYFESPAAAMVRMSATLNFTGTGLTSSDKVKIIASGSSCSSTSSPLLSNVNYNQAVVLLNTTSTAVPFRSLNLITDALVGQVCYARGDNPTIFAPVFKSGSSTSDFSVLPMQPSNMSTTPSSPTLGQAFSVTFAGSGLSNSADAAYLITSTSSTCSVSSSSDLCDGTSSNTQYPCSLSGSGSNSLICNVTADPDSNSATTLCGCYKIASSSNYAMVNGSVVLSARNPVYTVNPYPVYAGQSATLQFSGSGLSANDVVKFVASSSTCNDAAIGNVSTYAVTVASSSSSSFSMVGPGSLCLRVCFMFSGTSLWIISRPATSISITPSCSSTLLYISPFALTYSNNPASVSSRATIATTFAGGSNTPSAFIVVPGQETCVLVSCGSGAACSQAASSSDFFSAISSSTAFFSISRVGQQVVCVSLGSSYIPVLLAAGSTYSFTSLLQNPSSYSAAPAAWRVAMSNITLSLSGSGLNATNDVIKVISGASLLSANVCPVEAAVVTLVLSATATNTDSNSTVSYSLRGADAVLSNTTVYLCYYQGTSGSRVATFMGSMTFLAQHPTLAHTSGSLRAGELVSISFRSASDATLVPLLDTLTFFQFQSSSIAPSCRCDAATCANALSNFTTPIALTGNASTMVWRNAVGFRNYASDAVYVVCYNVNGLGSPTYTGQVTITQAHPSFYTLGSTHRVGLPISFTVSTLCSSCLPLNASDDLIIILNSTDCADVTSSTSHSGEFEATGPLVYSSTSGTASRSLVPLVEGFYRVCYKKWYDAQYEELTFSSQFVSDAFFVEAADPASFQPLPAQPTAGQYLIVNLSCSATTCSTCGTLRILRGAQTSCWNAALPAYSSTSCVGVATQYQFPNAFLAKGNYTVCFGDATGSRVPGTLVIAAANPSVYSVTSSSIFTNQGSRNFVSLTGSQLSSNDSIFILPNISYTCHDLQNSQLDIRFNPTYSGWWTPSTTPYPITGSGNSVQWVASDSLKRFAADILSSSSFCDAPGTSCTLQLCYFRQGTSWAPVSSATSAALLLLPANPQSVVFDVSSAVRVSQYVLATVVGTGLKSTDYLYFSDGFCELLNVVANSTSAGSASADGTTWQGVIRFSSRNTGTVRGCYVSGQSTTEIPSIPTIASVGGTLFYMKLAQWNTTNREGTQNHTITQYESFYLAGTTSIAGTSQIVNVASMYMVAASAECNYLPFAIASTTPVQVGMTRVPNQTSYFLGRPLITGSFALCLNTSGFLFRLTASIVQPSAVSIAVLSPNPISYSVSPVRPFQFQDFSIRFQFDSANLEGQNITGDAVALISGNLSDCGFDNSTVVIPLQLASDGTSTATGFNMSIPITTNFTVCYRKYNGSFATVPRNGRPDVNLQVNPLYPNWFSPSPLSPQVGVSLNITFYANSTGPLSAQDRAYLVFVNDSSRTGPLGSDCNQAAAISSSSISLVSSGISVWPIPWQTNTLTTGNYTVCYIVNSNGAGAVVLNPGFLVVSPRQDPRGVTTDSIGGTSLLYSGERFRLIFLSNASLAPSLSFDATNGSDVVIFSQSLKCTSPLSSQQVSAIPSSFGFATPTNITEPFLHLRFRTTGSFYVCMKRYGRLPQEQYYDFEPVGGPDTPSLVTIRSSPITAATMTPFIPRVSVPRVLANLAYASGFTNASFSIVFFAPYLNQTFNDSIANDFCYLPPVGEAQNGSTTTDISLTMNLATRRLSAPFSRTGFYTVCYGLPQRTYTSLASPVFVGNPSPITYTVPSVVSPGAAFSIVFTAIDPIFTATTNIAVVVPVDQNTTLDCSVVTAANGTSTFQGAFAGNSTVASVSALVPDQGTYYLCFKTYDQVEYFPVVNGAGGYTFLIGGSGPTQYDVNPTGRYAGQSLTITIFGNGLQNLDVAKVVRVNNSTNSSSISPQFSYYVLCTNASTVDSNVENVNRLTGAGTNLSTYNASTLVTVRVRVLQLGTYILCYRTSASSSWVYVPIIPGFVVNAPLPSFYLATPSIPIATQSFTLSVNSTSGGLSVNDSLRFVERTSGFDCTDSATQASGVTSTVLQTSSTSRLFTVCALRSLAATVCYLLPGGTWAEVPAGSLNGLYAPLTIVTNPFTVLTVSVSNQPRQMEPFLLRFFTTDGSRIQRLAFVLGNITGCNTSVSTATPLFLQISPVELSVLSALSQSGTYTVLVASDLTSALVAVQNFTLVIGNCDPCTVTPQLLFVGTSYNLTFRSTSGTFSTQDAVRLISTTAGTLNTPSLCNTSSSTLAPTSINSTTSQFLFTTTNVGTYYVCYRKNTSTDFAVVGQNGVAQLVTVAAAQPTSATVCPTPLFAGEGATWTFATSLGSSFNLSNADLVYLVAGNTPCTSATTTVSLTFVSSVGNTADFSAVLPSSFATVNYSVCYRHAQDGTARRITTTAVQGWNPSQLSLSPTSLTVGMTNTSVTLLGVSLSSTDAVYFVSNTTSCAEYCSTRPISPTSVAPAYVVDASQLPTRYVMHLNGSFATAGDVSICYRLSGGTLARLPLTINIGPANPVSFSADFVPRVGTRPTFTFVGTGLSALDAVKVVSLGASCETAMSLSTGIFNRSTGNTSSFLVPLLSPLTNISYTICYTVNQSGWVPVPPTLLIRSGGPTLFVSSNAVMVGRATEISFPERDAALQSAPSMYGAGDQVKLICATCSCWTDSAVTSAYGVTSATSPTNSTMRLRVGFAVASSYSICFRVSDSGFAAVGTILMSVSPPSPSAFTAAPVSPYQGQRITVGVSGGTSLSSSDSVMIVSPSRGCWDSIALNSNGILIPSDLVSSLTDSTSSSRLVQFPSLGPNASVIPSFPVNAVVCFRQANQQEYLHVPFPMQPFVVSSANPSTFITTPAVVNDGMINVTVRFVGSLMSGNDVAYATVGPFGDRICDSVGSTFTSPVGNASTFSFTPLVNGSSIVTLCYIRDNATVAELPRQVLIGRQNPSSFSINATAPRNREYVKVTLNGTQLTPASISLNILSVPCYDGAALGDLFSVIGRRGDVVGNSQNTSITTVVQFLASSSSPFTAYVCTKFGGAWTQIGVIMVDIAKPAFLTVASPTPRVGQRISLLLSDNDTSAFTSVAVVPESGVNSWCHNFTSNLEPAIVMADGSISTPIWKTDGTVRVCLQDSNSTLWVDVDDSPFSVSAVQISSANPATMWTVPATPRVGQQVTVYMSLLVPASGADRLILSSATNSTAGCDSVALQEQSLPLTVFNDTVAAITVLDAADPLQYQSFSSVSSWRLCYFSSLENAWNVVTGTILGSTFAVSSLSPYAWRLVSGKLVVQKQAVISLFGVPGSLSPTVDAVWAVPLSYNCSQTPSDCAYCIPMSVDPTVSNSSVSVTAAFSSILDGNFSLCYNLRAATPSMVPGTMTIATSDIQCHEESFVQVGRRQNITIRTVANSNTSLDAMLFSFYGSLSGICNTSLLPDFPVARATMVSSSSTSVTYSLEWPVTMNASRYTMCYRHEGEYGRVCSCTQLANRSSDCFISTSAAVPSAFTPSFAPQYVGQRLTLNVQTDGITLLDVFLVVDRRNNLTTCRDARASSATLSPLLIGSLYSFKHNYSTGAQSFLVCARIPGTVDYVRIPTETNVAQLLTIRSYLSMGITPSSITLLRAYQTMMWTFQHTSQLVDDHTAVDDAIALVPDAAQCNESAIDDNATLYASYAANFVLLNDSTIGGFPSSIRNVTSPWQSSAFVTLSSLTSNRTFAVCYRLSGATWAVVNAAISVLPQVFTSCVMTPTVSLVNGDSVAGHRAMEYIVTRLAGVATTFNALTLSTDAIRVVMEPSACYNDSAAVYVAPKPFNVSQSLLSTAIFSSRPGLAKVCYQLGAGFYSPVCDVQLASPSPLARRLGGCSATGQTLNISLSYDTTVTSTGHFSTLDAVWAVSDSAECFTASAGDTVPSSAVYLNYTTTTRVSPTGNTSSITLPPVVVGSGLSAIRLCYRNANGTRFVLPIDMPTSTYLSIAARQPVFMNLSVSRPHVGQMLTATFTSNAQSVTNLTSNMSGILLPSIRQSNAFDATGVALQVFGHDGNCAQQKPVLYDAVATSNSTSVISLVYPHTSGIFTACYQLLTCSVADTPVAFRVYESNPAAAKVNPASPRKGQLLNVTFLRVQNESDALLLAAGRDRGAMVVGSSTVSFSPCFALDSAGGLVVAGNTTFTWMETIVYADPPTAPSSTEVVGCYLLDASPSWSAVPNSAATIAPANPSQFITVPTTPIAFSKTSITFFGSTFSSGDSVKVIAKSLNCSAASVPPADLQRISGFSFVPGGSSGWTPTVLSSNISAIDITSNSTGIFSVCYKLAADSVWTLMYGDLVIADRNPAMTEFVPVSALESELFTVVFTSSTQTVDPSIQMSSSDQVELIAGSQGPSVCLTGSQVNVIAVGPSRTDLLPNASYFQLDAGTRGTYTLCYVRYLFGVRYPVWGFPLVIIRPNPVSFYTHVPSPLVRQYVGLIFQGFGLQSSASKFDTVKLVSTALPQTDVACQVYPSDANVSMISFRASGNQSIQTVLVSYAGVYSVCYKLFGGQFHHMGLIAFSAGAPQLSGTHRKQPPYVDGEQLTFNVTFGSMGWRTGDYVFLSALNCSDLDVSTNFLTVDNPAMWPYATYLQQTPNGDMQGSLRPLVSGEYAICYRSPLAAYSGVTSILEASISIGIGYPGVLGSAITTNAQRLLTFAVEWTNASLLPLNVMGSGFYTVVTSSQASCQGLVAPNNILLGTTTWSNATHAHLRGAIKDSGTYYLCVSNPTGMCGINGRECARVIGTIRVSTADPLGWAAAPTSAQFYVSEAIKLSFWITDVLYGTSAFLRSISTSVTLDSVVLACDNATAPTVPLSNAVMPGYWIGTPSVVSTYAVCAALPDGISIAVFPTLPLSVLAGKIISARCDTVAPQVSNIISLLIEGNGISPTNDTLQLVLASTVSAVLPSSTLQAACSAVNATTRFTAQSIDSSSSSLVATSSETILFDGVVSVAGAYALCYQFAHSKSWVLALATPIVVDPLVQVVDFSSSMLFAMVPFSVTLQGISLFNGSVGFDPVSTGCTSSSAVFSIAQSTVSGSVKTLATLSSPGQYHVCYVSALGNTLPLQVLANLGTRRVVAAKFEVQPSCMEAVVCVTQPQVSLLDANGVTSTDVGSLISLTLRNANDDSDRADALSGNETYAYLSIGRFEFLTATVNAAGVFYLVATVQLLGGQTIVTRSASFTVSRNTSLQTLALACEPVSVPRLANAVTLCTISTLVAPTATVFSVSTSSGSATIPITTPGLNPPVYTFNVILPLSNYSVNYILVTVTTIDSRFPGRAVLGSPAVVRIVTTPDATTMLLCSAPLIFSGVRYVRVAEFVSCAIQGRVRLGQQPFNIIPNVTALSATETVDSGTYSLSMQPSTLDGMVVLNTMAASGASTVTIHVTLADTNVDVVGSPASFAVLRVPNSLTTSFACASRVTGSIKYFLPSEALTCILSLADLLGPILVPNFDLTFSMSGVGGSIPNISGSALVQQTSLAATVPIAAGSTLQISRREMSVLSSADQTFSIIVWHLPSATISATFSGVLVVVTAVSGVNRLIAGEDATVTLSGSGLSPLHSYLVSLRALCDGEWTATTVGGGVAAGDVVLRFTTPAQGFFVCFAPNGTHIYQLLVPIRFSNITAAAATGLSSDDIVLIIVGSILGGILLLLLLCLCWYLWCQRVAIAGVPPSSDVSYVPRVNDQFIYNPVITACTPRSHTQQRPDGTEFSAVAPNASAADDLDSVTKSDTKKRRKKAEASAKKIAMMQHQEQAAVASQASEHPSYERVPLPTAPLAPAAQNVIHVEVEERHTTHVMSSPAHPETTSVFVSSPPPPPGVYMYGQQSAAPVSEPAYGAGPYMFAGHTALQYARDSTGELH